LNSSFKSFLWTYIIIFIHLESYTQLYLLLPVFHTCGIALVLRRCLDMIQKREIDLCSKSFSLAALASTVGSLHNINTFPHSSESWKSKLRIVACCLLNLPSVAFRGPVLPLSSHGLLSISQLLTLRTAVTLDWEPCYLILP
jgi:hypothetical protein